MIYIVRCYDGKKTTLSVKNCIEDAYMLYVGRCYEGRDTILSVKNCIEDDCICYILSGVMMGQTPP